MRGQQHTPRVFRRLILKHIKEFETGGENRRASEPLPVGSSTPALLRRCAGIARLIVKRLAGPRATRRRGKQCRSRSVQSLNYSGMWARWVSPIGSNSETEESAGTSDTICSLSHVFGLVFALATPFIYVYIYIYTYTSGDRISANKLARN